MSTEDKTPPAGGAAPDGGHEFTPIASQADLDRIIGERLSRERTKFADYDDLKAKAAKFDTTEQASLSELERERKARADVEGELTKYRTRDQVATWATEIVKDSNVPASVLRGTTKEELLEHFEQVKALAVPPARTRTHVPPGKPTEGDVVGSRAAAAIREMRRGS